MASPFSGRAGRNAAIWTANYLGDVQRNVESTLGDGLRRSLAALGLARGALDGGLSDSLGALGTGYAGARSHLSQLGGLFAPYQEAGRRALASYADATGADGQAGFDQAAASFRASPGYRFMVDEALAAHDRRAAARGMLASGNTIDATTRLASGLADREWSDHLERLLPLIQTGSAAAGAQGQALRSLADLEYAYGAGRSGLHSGHAGDVADIFGAEADLRDRHAGRLADLQTEIAGEIVPAGQQGLLAGRNAAASRLDALMGGARLLSNLAGSFLKLPTNSVGARLFGFGG